jgi:cell wall-associated NlpC family hydrolase
MKAKSSDWQRALLAARMLVLWPFLWTAMLIASGCAPFRPGLPSQPLPPGATTDAGVRIAHTALRYVGVPYRYGGSEPSQGFDCSGLVSYVHGVDGITVPRTAALQFAAASPVDSRDLRPGDLVFFRLTPGSRAVTHVGIYTGAGRFVHAPQTGRNVGESRLDDDYYRERFAGAGRYYSTSSAPPPGPKAPR